MLDIGKEIFKDSRSRNELESKSINTFVRGKSKMAINRDVTSLKSLEKYVVQFVNGYDSPEIETYKVVLYGGNPDAYIMIIARDLGKDEIEAEEPLIGRAGQLFRRGAELVGFDPAVDFFMCNTVPLKPKGNKAFSDLVRTDFKWILNDLFKIVLPSYIITLGFEATKTVFPECAKMKPFVGMMFERKGIKIFPNFHPSYISRQGGLKSDEGQSFISALKQVKDFTS